MATDKTLEAAVLRRRKLDLPTFMEGYPRIVGKDLRAALLNAKPLCVWSTFNSENPAMPGRRLGHALAAEEEIGVLISYEVFPTKDVKIGWQSGKILIAFKEVGRGPGPRRMMMICPGCNVARAQLALDQQWRCRICHGLKYRSSQLPYELREYNKYKILAQTILEGRPKGMHRKSYEDILKRTAQFSRVYDKRLPPVVNSNYRNGVRERWMTIDEDEDWRGSPYLGLSEASK
jgi:hypothetical protein